MSIGAIITISIVVLVACLFIAAANKIKRESFDSLPDEAPPETGRRTKTDTDIENKCSFCENKAVCPIVGHSERCGLKEV